MPNTVDLTADFRTQKSVREYLLIGDLNSCGDLENSWGENGMEDAQPPFEADGFERKDLEELCKLQISRSDLRVLSRSLTTSFRTNKEEVSTAALTEAPTQTSTVNKSIPINPATPKIDEDIRKKPHWLDIFSRRKR